MSIKQSKDSAELLIEICKQINMRKYIRRQIIDIRIKTRSLSKFRQSRLEVNSLLTPEEQLFSDEIKVLRKHLYKSAERVLKNNNLTVNNIKAEEFELGSNDLVNGHCELLSPNGEKTYFYSIVSGEIVSCTTPEEIEKAKNLVMNIELIAGIHTYVQFMNILPF